MKTILKNIILTFCGLLTSIAFIDLYAQKVHVDYKQTVGTSQTFEVEVWVTNLSIEPCKLSALNTVFGYMKGIEDGVDVRFELARDFVSLAQPIFSVIPSKKVIRATQIPVLNSEMAIPLGNKPQLFGTLKVKTDSYLKYPISLVPSTTGNPTVQSIVYTSNSINSTALSMNNMSITTDENPLILRLMEQPVPYNFAEGDVQVYPNPTSQFVYFESKDLELTNWSFQIFNQTGGLIYSSTVSDVLQKYVDVSSYPAGTYFIHVLQDDMMTKKKLVKVN